MDAVNYFVPILAMITLGAVCIYSLVERNRTERQRHDPEVPKSTLAEDAGNTADQT